MLPQIAAALLPYIAITTGLIVFHNAWAAIISYHACIVVVLALSKPAFGTRLIPKFSNLSLPLVFGMSGGVLLFLLWPLLSVPGNINSYLNSIGLTPSSWPWFILYYVSVNPFLEEYFWRGSLGSGDKHLLASDLMFAGYHGIVLAGKITVLWLAAALVILTFAAWYWRQISRESGGLIIPVLSHAAADASVIAAIYLLTRN